MLKQLANNRLELLDFIRGIAIGLMFIFHLSFGLNEIGLLNIDFSQDYFWISFRALIVFLFLMLVGVGLVLSKNNKNKTFFESLLSKRLALLFTYMMLITLFSYYVRPQHYVYFGILHLIFISSLMGRILINFSSVYLGIISFIYLLVGLNLDSSQLNHPLVYWLGLGNKPAITDDFVPLFPWFSLVVFGLILGKYLVKSNTVKQKINKWKAQSWFSKLICWAGKNSIHLYFFHFQFFYFMIWIINF